MILTIRKNAYITSPDVLIGYLTTNTGNINKGVSIYDKEVQRAINGTDEYEGNAIIPSEAYTQDEIDTYLKAVPPVISMRQARLALLSAGLLPTVDAAIQSGTDEAMKIEWDFATEVKRDWASLIAMTESMGMSSAQLDGLFIAGDKL